MNSMVLAIGLLMTHPNYLDPNESPSIASAITAGERRLANPPNGSQVAYSIGFVDRMVFPSSPVGVRIFAVELQTTTHYHADQPLLGPVVEKTHTYLCWIAGVSGWKPVSSLMLIRQHQLSMVDSSVIKLNK